jgi:hypothetical protein
VDSLHVEIFYFIRSIDKLYYIDQNDNLGIRARLKNWNRGSTNFN